MSTMSARLPGWLRLWLLVFGALAIYLVVAWAAEPLRPDDSGRFTRGVLIVAAIIAPFSLLVWFGDRQLGGSEQRRLFQEAARTGQIPVGADTERWRAVLGAQLKQQRPQRDGRWNLLIAVVGIGFVVNVLASIGDPGFGVEDIVTRFGIFVAITVVAVLLARATGRRQRTRRARLVELLGLSVPD